MKKTWQKLIFKIQYTSGGGSFGNKMSKILKELRLERGLTQEEVGKIIGVQKAAIQKYEKGDVMNMKRSILKEQKVL